MEIKVADNNIMYNQCLEIRKRVFVEEQNVPMDREVDEYEDTATHILLIDDEPIGTVRYRPASEGMIKVERMAVLPEERGRKLGFKLMEFVHDHALEHGYTRAKLGAQVHAIDFYRKLGYTVSSDEFEDAGIPHVYMEKAL
ncbi:GNAT family N-acetyltransferase [Salinicoccus roseus]|uniref:GNAT family N-acetyltransferase n=1 Tax=Salinicoccus roseus TaxID=45670 RepID=UPI000F50D59D|nr:GNAT family N-acetyltransferase [Salinicoccus roseus]RPE54824.1 putative GNAT family N-acyltransferase [Salinicoccus roseus]GGA62298.1 GNAT family acetyltransferase [Salinicoccus roseus]